MPSCNTYHLTWVFSYLGHGVLPGSAPDLGRGVGPLGIIGDWNAKVGSQETPGVTGKFGLKIRNEAGQRLIEFCQENALVITNTLFQQHMDIFRWSTPKSG